jgi:nucleoside-diphosphate-sugar epimerase
MRRADVNKTQRRRRSLVVGAAGFAASELCLSLIARGDEVIGIDRHAASDHRLLDRTKFHIALEMGLRFTQLDIAADDLSSILDGVDVVFYLAGGLLDDNTSSRSLAHRAEDLILPAARLLDTCLTTKPQRVVLGSSSAVYGKGRGRLAKESDPLSPITSYGFASAACEELLRTYDRAAQTSSVALRYSSVYGPGQPPDMFFAQLIDSALTQRPLNVANFPTQLDVVYVQDAITATIAAAERGPRRAYNVGSGSIITITEVSREIERITGLRPRMTAEADPDLRLPMPGLNLTRPKRELGYESRTPIHEGLERQISVVTNSQF